MNFSSCLGFSEEATKPQKHFETQKQQKKIKTSFAEVEQAPVPERQSWIDLNKQTGQ